LQYHSLIEWGNRMVTVFLVVVIGATFLAALARRPRRADLVWLAGGLVVGVLAEAVLGGIVVYTKLNPYLVMVHFLATVAMVGLAAVFVHRSSRHYGAGSGRRLVPRAVLLAARAEVGLLALVLAAGSATTGAAPDAGGAQGQEVAKRIPVALRDLAELHSTLAVLLIGLSLGLAVALHALSVPEPVRRGGRILVAVLAAQAGIGYLQYFTHLPAGVVELHELGATALVIGSIQLWLSLTHHAPEPAQLAVIGDGRAAQALDPAAPAPAPAAAGR
jgi:cytochrome c oxidase assembly protein subunit 15